MQLLAHRRAILGAVAAFATLLIAWLAGGMDRPAAAFGPEWRSQVSSTFTVSYCEGPDGLPGTGDERPKNNAEAGGQLAVTHAPQSDSWYVAGEFQHLRAGRYRVVVGSTAGVTGPQLATFEVVQGSGGVASFEASGLRIEAPDQYDSVWIERNGPPWGGGEHEGGGGGGGGGGCETGDSCEEPHTDPTAAPSLEPTPEATVDPHEDGGCGGGGGNEAPGSRWRIELEARFDLRAPVLTVTKHVTSSEPRLRPPDGTPFAFELVCGEAFRTEFSLADDESVSIPLATGEPCSLRETAGAGVSTASGLFEGLLIDEDREVTVVNRFEAPAGEPPEEPSSAPASAAPPASTPGPTVVAGPPLRPTLIGFESPGPVLFIVGSDLGVGELLVALGAAGAEPAKCVLGSLLQGRWLIFIPAGRAALNTLWWDAYQSGVPAGTPLFARCG